MIFWLSVTALLALALVILLLPILRISKPSADDQRLSQNIQIALEKKRQWQDQLAAGDIDQATFDGAIEDLQNALALELNGDEAELVESRGRWMAVVLMLLIPLVSISLYLQRGEYRIIENPQLAQAPPPVAAAPAMSREQMETAIKQRLRENPQDAEGWFLLGRLMMGERRYDQAVTAFQRSNDLIANEPGILFALADALAMQNNGSMQGEPEALVERGLSLAPMFPNGLWLAGMAAEQRQDYQAAHGYWSQLLPLIQDNPASLREIKDLLAMLVERDPNLVSGEDKASGATISVAVDISAELRSRAEPETAVFVYAKAMQGPPMPLAVKRIRLADLPTRLTLGDADAMMPALKLSSFSQVIVGARVSFSGNPVAQSGDFFTEVDAVDSNDSATSVALTIDQIK